jgi:hypothetical protein
MQPARPTVRPAVILSLAGPSPHAKTSLVPNATPRQRSWTIIEVTNRERAVGRSAELRVALDTGDWYAITR